MKTNQRSGLAVILGLVLMACSWSAQAQQRQNQQQTGQQQRQEQQQQTQHGQVQQQVQLQQPPLWREQPQQCQQQQLGNGGERFHPVYAAAERAYQTCVKKIGIYLVSCHIQSGGCGCDYGLETQNINDLTACINQEAGSIAANAGKIRKMTNTLVHNSNDVTSLHYKSNEAIAHALWIMSGMSVGF